MICDLARTQDGKDRERSRSFFDTWKLRLLLDIRSEANGLFDI